MSAAFTPGPWEFERGADSQPRPWIGRLKDHEYSALACGATHEEAMANARLIAAAPELYEALSGALKVIEGDGITYPKKWDAALAKARGDQ